MTTTKNTETQTFRAAGFTDEIVTCEICGRDELKGTVRLVIVDDEGNEDGEIFAGVICAARRSGRRAAEIRHEAKTADDAAREAHLLWRGARNFADIEAGNRALARMGLERTFKTYRLVEADPAYLAEMAAWSAANPEPARPRR